MSDEKTAQKVEAKSPSRLGWLDANRVCAAVGVVLIHSTTDTAGQPFAALTRPERAVPAALRVISEFSGSEIFVIFSMFLLALRLSKRELGYGEVLGDQAKRLFVPFLAWTVFYAFFRLVKASAFGYQDAIFAQVSNWRSWPQYLLLGTAQYHLHFIPTLFGILLAFPLFKSAVRYPVLGAAIIPCLYVLNSTEGWLWGHVPIPLLRDYLVRATKIACYTGYAMAAFSLFGVWKRGLSRDDAVPFFQASVFLLALCGIATLPYGAEIALNGRWVVRPGAAYYGHFLVPVFVFASFFGAQHATWSPRFSVLSKYTFGIYLTHPIAIDVYDITLRKLDWHLPAAALILSKFAFSVPTALGISYLISRTSLLSWLIGLQETSSRPKRPTSIAPAPAST